MPVKVVAIDGKGRKSIFRSQAEAARVLGVAQSWISRSIGTGRMVGKFRFRYAEQGERSPEDACGGRTDCKYWKRIDIADRSANSLHCCHYCLMHGTARQKDEEGNCLSYTRRKHET